MGLRTLYRFFHLYPGEGKSLLLLICLGLSWSLPITLGLKYADALFLIYVGADSLPIVYGICATLMILFSSLMVAAFHSFSPRHIFLAVIALAFAYYFLLLLAEIHFGSDHPLLRYSARIGAFIFFALFTSTFWSFVDQYYSLQDAKRLFAFLSSSIFTGSAITGLTMHVGYLQLEQVYLVILACLVITAGVVEKLHRLLKAVHDENALYEVASSGSSPLQLVRQLTTVPFAWLLMINSFLLFISITVTEFNYLSSLEKFFLSSSPLPLPNEEAGIDSPLTLFMGRAILGVSLANLALGLLLYSRMVRTFGLSRLLLATPLLLSLLYMGWLGHDALFFTVIALFMVEGSNYIVDDSNFNLLLSGLPPHLKYRVRLTIESFFEPIGMLLSSFLLASGWLDPKVMGLLFAMSLLVTAFFLGQQYGKAIYQNLRAAHLQLHRSVSSWMEGLRSKERQQTKEQLQTKIIAPDDEEALMAFELLLAMGQLPSILWAIEHSGHRSPQWKSLLLELLQTSPYRHHPALLDAITRWSQEESHSSNLNGTIHLLLAKEGLWHPERAIDYLHHPRASWRTAAILALKWSRAHLSAEELNRYRAMADASAQALLFSSDEEELLAGLQLLCWEESRSELEFLPPLLRDERIEVATRAMEAFALLADERYRRYRRLLISLLQKRKESSFRKACLTALARISGSERVSDLLLTLPSLRPMERRFCEQLLIQMGRRAVPVLLHAAEDRTRDDESRIVALRVVSLLAPPQLKATLDELIHREIERAYFYYWHAEMIQKRFSSIDLEILTITLRTSYRSAIAFILHLLGEAGQLEECELVIHSLYSRQPKVRGQALEALERWCDPLLLRELAPLLSDLPFEEKMRHCHYSWQQMSLEELLNAMIEAPSPLERMVALFYKRWLNQPEWRQQLLEQLLSGKEPFDHFAYELLKPAVGG